MTLPPSPSPNGTPTYKLAREYEAAGLGITPIRADGSKRPPQPEWQKGLGTAPNRLERWWGTPGLGIGILGGVLSGDLEVLDFDHDKDPESYGRWAELIDALAAGLRARLPHVETPTGGYHVYYRCPGHIEGNKVLARRADGMTTIETRGEGGQVLAPGCPPGCHPSGREYRHVGGPPITATPNVTVAERFALLSCAVALDEYEGSARNMAPAVGAEVYGRADRPGDDYDQKTDWVALLAEAGGTVFYTRGDRTYFTRPGKDSGVSATVGPTGPEKKIRLWVFSSNWPPFHAGAPSYTKFGAFAEIHHGGDLRAAARALGEKGFGNQAKKGPKIKLGSQAPADPNELVIEWASTITPEKVEWIWPGRIPRGKLTTFAGGTGVGKTFTLSDITSRVTTGKPWPDEPPDTPLRDPGRVLYVSGEDGKADTLIPRLMRLGANLERICFFKSKQQAEFTLEDIPLLERAIKQAGGVDMICIDPPTAFVGDVNDNNNAELRGLLHPLAELAEKYRLAIVFITHVNKSSGKGIPALERVISSVAWVAAVRAAHCFAVDPNDDDPEPGKRRRLFCLLKVNNAEERKALAYRLVKPVQQFTGAHALIVNDIPHVEWLGEVDTTADQAMNKEKAGGGPQLQVAVNWLVDRFIEQPRWPRETIKELADKRKISERTLYRALPVVGIQGKRDEQTKVYFWYVLEGWHPPDEDDNVSF